MPPALTDPRTVAPVFRVVAVAEALLVDRPAGRHVRQVGAARPPRSACSVFGPIHGAIFLAYVAVTLLAGRVLRWSPRTTVLALICSVPPLATVWFERLATRNDRLPRQQAVPAA